jgi:crotonobetainyl-CoA:carnitine CoA-transferase CaiB-like acyl-CoA transferase
MLTFIFDDGTSTFCSFAILAFLIRVRRSAIGSVIDIDLYSSVLVLLLLPTGFDYPGKLAAGGKLSQADSAHVELSVIGP